MFFRRFLSAAPQGRIARDIYSLIVAKARQPHFYSNLNVPDTVDGRFDMIALHAILIMNRLAPGGSAAKALSQKLFDEMFADMDRSLREMGAGDLSVGKKVRKMAEVFYGRAKAYREALARLDASSLEQAMARNIYPDGADPKKVASLARYVFAAARSLAAQNESDVVAGRPSFPDPEQF
ncbi:MAG TPA: ubiquinol-cytochrome C chaperone family protein [Aestuariivirgaceae bacterium]|nr:ubiquinol-cytochrome C chaperone family protein [Aestuariivirgaceae bacterium]